MRDMTRIARAKARHAVVEDNRFSSPLPLAYRPLHNLQEVPIAIKFVPNRNLKKPLAIVAPKSAILCARRKVRKEVLFAIGKQGRGNRRGRFNENSKVRCK